MNKIRIEPLPDGSLKATTDEFSPEVHGKAEEFLRIIAEKMGGQTTRSRRTDRTEHEHAHTHTHVHQK